MLWRLGWPDRAASPTGSDRRRSLEIGDEPGPAAGWAETYFEFNALLRSSAGDVAELVPGEQSPGLPRLLSFAGEAEVDASRIASLASGTVRVVKSEKPRVLKST